MPILNTVGYLGQKKGEYIKCPTCSSSFYIHPSRTWRKYCSLRCRGIAKRGLAPWNKGKVLLEMCGPNNPNWSGDKVEYVGIHNWISRKLGKPDTCSQCNKKGTGRNMNWANISGRYKRDIGDWIRMCPKCHRTYDFEKGTHKKLTKISL